MTKPCIQGCRTDSTSARLTQRLTDSSLPNLEKSCQRVQAAAGQSSPDASDAPSHTSTDPVDGVLVVALGQMSQMERQLLTVVRLGVLAQAVLRRGREHAGVVLLAAQRPERALAGVDKVAAAFDLAPVCWGARVSRHDIANLFAVEGDGASVEELHKHDFFCLVVFEQPALEDLDAGAQAEDKKRASSASLRRALCTAAQLLTVERS